jgi:antitoxin component YwqK of YwqJK toxin-antitoxin module
MIKYIIPFSIIIFCLTACGSEEDEVNEDKREVKVSERSKAAANRRDPRSRRDSLYSEVNANQENVSRAQSRKTRTTSKVIKKNIKDGLNLSYYPSGELKSEINYKNGKKDGIGKWYFKSGKLKYQGTWKNGMQEGNESVYYESGQLKAQGSLKNGRASGVYKEFSGSGELVTHMKYENGELIDLLK